MRRIKLFLFAFVMLTFSMTQLATAEWKANNVINQTSGNVYVIYSTWRSASGVFPRGYRTLGYYLVSPGQQRTFYAWSNNSIYFRVSKSGEALKPQSSTSTFSFWIHPQQAFSLVSSSMNESVSKGQLTYASKPKSQLVHENGFMKYSNGSQLQITSAWVKVADHIITPPPDDLPVDINRDGVVDSADIALVSSSLGQSGPNAADVNGDGVVNLTDLELVAAALGTTGGTGKGGGIVIPEGMVLIPAGEFQMGSNDPESQVREQPVHTVYVDAFLMDQYEVTNLDYKRFVLDNPQWQKSNIPRSLHDGDYLKHWTGNNYPAGKANHPVVYVSWYGAMAYAKWKGKRLPTEAEWERAARGGKSGLKYPWGNTISSARANYNRNVNDTTVVGSYAANGYDLYDMTGNVWEWCLDAYDADFYFTSPRENPLSDVNTIANVDLIINDYINVKSSRVLRGGSWTTTAADVRVAYRGNNAPTNSNYNSGFRCARAVSP